MVILLLTDQGENSPQYSKHAKDIMSIVKKLGYSTKSCSIDQYWCDNENVWHGPYLKRTKDKITGKQGIVLNRTSTYGQYAIKVASALEKENWLVMDSPSKILKCGDKWENYLQLQNLNVPTIPTVLVSSNSRKNPIYKYPIVVKARNGSSGREVYLVRNSQEYNKALELLDTKNNNGVILQPYIISENRPRDLRVHVVFGKKMLILERTASENSWYTNAAKGAVVKEYDGPLLTKASNIAEKVADNLKLHWCAVDLLITEKEELVICEVNIAPGVSGTIEQVGEKPIANILKTLIEKGETILATS